MALKRPKSNRMLAGVCSGLAKHFSLDPTLVRLAWAILVLIGGTGILLYLLMWIIVPEE
ncbi:MAG: PspC domain-containing protein [Bacteroidia bacterium]|nr:PspC domain-containing protein [Bacteroidia bacterium]